MIGVVVVCEVVAGMVTFSASLFKDDDFVAAVFDVVVSEGMVAASETLRQQLNTIHSLNMAGTLGFISNLFI